MDEADQQIHLIRIKREIFLGSHFEFRFSSVTMVIGLAERQQTTGKPGYLAFKMICIKHLKHTIIYKYNVFLSFYMPLFPLLLGII